MSSRCMPFIVVRPPIHLWDFPDRATLWPLDRPRPRTIQVQPPVRAPAMIGGKVVGQEPPQMSPVQVDHVVQAFAADTPDQSLDVWILPRTSGSHQYFFVRNAYVVVTSFLDY
jgi:hypothetical protein